MSEVNFFREDVKFSLRQKAPLIAWLKKVAKQEGARIQSINYVFCSDQYLFKLNVHYLRHRTLTDIITFDNSENPLQLEGDVFISIDRVRENADKLKSTFQAELYRVIVHGLLHLIGYHDKRRQQKVIMRGKEDEYLLQLKVPRGTTRRPTRKRST